MGEGEISPASCEYGYRGYSYRICSGGELGDVNNEFCEQKVPERLTYDASIYELVMGTNILIAAPTYQNIIEEFYLGENTVLPAGLTLNTQTGEISGIPTQESALNTYTIYGRNQKATTNVVINISVKKGTCVADGFFPITNVGEEYTYSCASGGAYVGTQKRTCYLGESNGEWGPISGFCMHIGLLIAIVLVVVVIVLVIVFFIVRVSRKTKAVGGVRGKGKAMAVNKKGTTKHNNTKTVKSVKV